MSDDHASSSDTTAATPAPRSLDDALALMRDLRARCEWDRVQTHASLRPYLIEEAHEVDDAIAQGDDAVLRDELGDLFLQVLFHSVVAEERGAFGMQDVAGALIAKMHARHPHLYGDGVKRSWESMKAAKAKRSTLEDGLPAGLPSLHRAHRLQDRAAGVGFDWPDALGPLAKVREEVEEVASLIDPATGAVTNQDALEAELGDLLFAVVNLCRKTGVHGALALDRTNAKFVRRYATMERLAQADGKTLSTLTLDEQDHYWDAVKAEERAG
ncbi:putative nucleoside triphosphate pyrophosphohydrolase [Gemmatimonas aurantiaca T-27]|nr:nucleoside triphosphate pyrophosphohydrolase [Gemmatimonas aurantiaca]BAH38490.1 putative nucleoside triphosphate pyrophosphohydrolase [Gemmatimonas aurantiaca T-27]